MYFSCKNNFRFNVTRKEYEIPRFPFSEYKIAHLSDIHLGFGIDGNILKTVVDKTLALAPDLVVITGDLFECDVNSVENSLSVLTSLSAAIPVYYVFGNHDFEQNSPEEVIQALKKLGINILINSSVWIGNTEGFHLAGVCDPAAQFYDFSKNFEPDINKTLSQTTGNAPVILLSHRPIVRYLEENSVDLMLSGHLHGGQIFPFGLLSIYLYEDSGERISVKDMEFKGPKFLHVSKGIGCTKFPFRFMVKGEITLIEINPA